MATVVRLRRGSDVYGQHRLRVADIRLSHPGGPQFTAPLVVYVAHGSPWKGRGAPVLRLLHGDVAHCPSHRRHT